MNNDRHMGLMIHIWMAEEKKEETYQQNEFTPFGWKFMYQDKPPKGNPVVTMIDTKMRNSGVITNPEIHKRLRHRGHLQSGELKDTKDNGWTWFYYHDLDKNGDPPESIRNTVESLLLKIANNEITPEKLKEIEKNNDIVNVGQGTLLDSQTLVTQTLEVYQPN